MTSVVLWWDIWNGWEKMFGFEDEKASCRQREQLTLGSGNESVPDFADAAILEACLGSRELTHQSEFSERRRGEGS